MKYAIPLAALYQTRTEARAAHSGIDRLLNAVGVVVAVAPWHVLVELGQRLLRGRAVSYADLAARALGGALSAAGTYLVGTWVIGRVFIVVRCHVRPSRLGALLDLYVADYVVWMLLPFIPAISPSEIAVKSKSRAVQLAIFSDHQSQPLQVAYPLAVSAATPAR